MNLYAANRLFADALGDFARVSPFYAREPRVAALCSDLPGPTERPLTSEDIEALIRFNTLSSSDAAKVRQSAASLADPNTLVVLTGQQPGLLLGPLYTVIKALHAIALARRIESESGRATVPVFWIGSDDHDFEEVRGVRWFNSSGEDQRFELPMPAGSEGHSVGPLPLDRGAFGALLEQITASTPDTEFRPQVLEMLEEAAEASETFGDLFRHLMLRLLQREGLLVVDPWFSAIKRHLPEILRPEIEKPGETTALILETNARLRAEGCKPQVHRREGDLNLFRYVDGVRCRVVRDGEKFESRHPATGAAVASQSRAEILAALEKSPEGFSPNVVTKPLVRDRVFRPHAYIGGPGEVAYYAQFKTLYERAVVPMPAIVPRVQMALVASPTKRALGRLGFSAEQWLAMNASDRAEAAARGGESGAMITAFDERRRSLLDQIDALEESVVTVDPGLRKSAQRIRSSVESSLDKLAGQVTRSVQARDEQVTKAASKVNAALEPGGQPQERTDNIFVPHLLMHGPGLIERLASEVDLDNPDLRVVDLT